MAGYRSKTEIRALRAKAKEGLMDSDVFCLFLIPMYELHDPAHQKHREYIFMTKFRGGILDGNWQPEFYHILGNFAYSAQTRWYLFKNEFVGLLRGGRQTGGRKAFYFKQLYFRIPIATSVNLGARNIFKLIWSWSQERKCPSDLTGWASIGYADVYAWCMRKQERAESDLNSIYGAVI